MPISTKLSAGRVRSTYEFINAQRGRHTVRMLCRTLGVAPCGYYKWLAQPLSKPATEDARLLGLIRASFTASQGIYGAPRVFLDLREAGETCSTASRVSCASTGCAPCMATGPGAGPLAHPPS